MEINEHLSLTNTYNRIRSLLYINKEDLKELSKNNIQLLLNNHSIEYNFETESYFSNLFIPYKDKLIPLYFFETKEIYASSKKFIKKNNSKCIINPLILSFLMSYQIKIDNFENITDPSEIYFKITSALNLLELNDLYPIIEGIAFFNKDILFSTSLYFFLTDAIENKKDDKKINDFFNTITVSNVININKDKFFNLYTSTLETLETNKTARVLTSDYNILFDYLTNVIDNLLTKKKTLCIVCNDTRDYNILLDLLKRKYLSQITFKMNKYSKDEILSIIDQPLKTHFKKEQKREFQRYINIKNRIGTLINENITGFSLPISADEISYLSDKIHETVENTTDSFKVSDYNEENLKNDILFFESIKKLKKINLNDIKSNIFYGLTSTGKRENYDLMIVTMIQTINYINKFINVLKSNEIKSISDEDITSFEMFEEYGREIELINSYNGFPKKYFEVKITEEKEQDLIDLKKLYQNLSSTQLLIKVIFKKSIFKIDLKKVLLDYDLDKGNKKKSINIICKQLKRSKKDSDYKVIFEIIRSYLNSKKELEDNLPKYIIDYGDTVTTMNGVVEIESNIKYIVSFNKMKKKSSSFSLDNPVIKKCFKDYRYTKKLYNSYLEATTIYQDIKKNINLYIGYFLDDEFKFLKSDFDDLKKHFIYRIKGNYDEFYELSIFNSSLENSSLILQSKVIERINNNESILSLENYYFTSLVRSYQKIKNKEFQNQNKLFNESKSDFIFSIMKSTNSFERLRQDNYFKILENKMKNKEYIDARNNIDNSKKSVTEEEIIALQKLIKTRFPISLVKASSLSEIMTNAVDTVIVFNSYLLNELELFSTLRIGKHVLFISKNNRNDMRISFYPEFQLTSESLYLNQFRLKNLSNNFITSLKKEIEKRDYKLIMNNPVFPLIIENIDNPLKKIALLPDLFIDSKYQKEVYSSLPKFLMRVYNLPLFYLDTISFILEPLKTSYIFDEEVEEVNSKYKNYLENKKKSKRNLTDEEIYQKEINKIISNFKEYNSKEMNLKLLESKKYDELFYSLQPVKKEIIDSIDDSNFQKYVSYMRDEIGLIIIQSGFYMDISKKMIKFRKSKKENRQIEDLSIIELMQGIKEFVSSFKSFDLNDLEEIFASLVDYNKDDANFSLRFKEAISMMILDKIIIVKDDIISLNL